jgi:hypothetical protein
VFVGWVYERPDGGRTFSTTLGHPYRNFQREPFRRMLVNAILWTAGTGTIVHVVGRIGRLVRVLARGDQRGRDGGLPHAIDSRVGARRVASEIETARVDPG